jgi:hypothetical protein
MNRPVVYPGASDTTRELLAYWFERSHLTVAKDGAQIPFRYYFCQREAIETLIYLYEGGSAAAPERNHGDLLFPQDIGISN